MSIQDYITATIEQVTTNPSGHENADGLWLTVDFDIGVNHVQDTLVVDEASSNRIRFSLEVKR